jgi:hypothetical protein
MASRPLPFARTLRAVFLLLCVTALFAVSPPAQAEAPDLFAVQLDANNVDRLRVGGPDAIGGIGDWAIGNGILCATISDPAHESFLSVRGGVLVDLGHCALNDDQFGVLQPMLNLGRDNALPVERVRAQVTGDEAVIIASGEIQGVRFENRYTLSRARPHRLGIETRLERVAPGDRIFLFGDVALHGNRSLAAMTLASRQPELSVGFTHPTVDVDDPIAMARALVRADTQVLIGGSALPHGIAYGWHFEQAQRRDPEGGVTPLAMLGMNGEHFSILAAYTDALLFGGDGPVGLLELAQSVLMDLSQDEVVTYVRSIHVGDRADAASATDSIWHDGPQVEAQLSDANAWLHVATATGAPVTFVAAGPGGEASFRLPPGSRGPHQLRIVGRAGDETTQAFQVEGDRVELGRITVPGTLARLDLPRGETMRLVFVGRAGTETPRLGWEGLDVKVGARRFPSSTETNSVSLAGVQTDPRSLELAPGQYRVLSTRGPLFSVGEALIELSPGERKTLRIPAPRRVIEDAGRVSADLHVHTAASDDSAYPIASQLRAFAAQGADVLVSTEHDRIWNHAAELARLGLSDRVASIIGVEVTSTVKSEVAPYTIGHANAFPLTLEPQQPRGGAPNSENRRLRDVVADLRARDPLPLLQLNHPREGGFDSGNGSYFTHLGVVGAPLDPTRPLSEAPNRALLERDPETGLRDIDFEAIELLTGPAMLEYRLTRADWYSLLLQGERRVGTANSDSHKAGVVIALARNHVVYDGPLGARLDQAAFMAALRKGQSTGSTGPVLRVSLDGVVPGDTLAGSKAKLRIDVEAADWVPVADVRVYVNATRVARRAIAGPGRIEVPLDFVKDAFVTVEVEGDPASDPSGRYAALAAGFVPFAFSNPIFVDHDADGVWTAPGLPETLPDTLAQPREAP